jgi:hypothetical protein
MRTLLERDDLAAPLSKCNLKLVMDNALVESESECGPGTRCSIHHQAKTSMQVALEFFATSVEASVSAFSRRAFVM